MTASSAVVSEQSPIERQDEYIFLLGAEYPGLSADQIAFSSDPNAEIVRADWAEWSAWFPQSEDAAARQRVAAAILPHLRGFVSPAIPVAERSHVPDDWRKQWFAAPRLEGRPLHPELLNDQNRERLVRDLATFCHELHGFSVERARSLGAAPARQWRDEHEQLSRRSLSVVRPLVTWSRYTWARRWWRRCLDDDALWSHPPALVHGDISEQRLLVDTFVQQLVAVDGWQQIGVADPALDFARLVDTYGTELTWRIVEHYGELGSTADASLFRRVRMQQTVRRFREVVEAADANDDDEPSQRLLKAIERLS